MKNLSKQNKAVFLDRDGIIIELVKRSDGTIGSPRTLQDFHFVNDIKRQIQRLQIAGFKICVVTNQPDVARKQMSYQVLRKMHEILINYIPVTIECCFHDDNDNCECRKPKSGMILNCAKRFFIDLKRSWMIGDRFTDIEAGHTAGCRTIFMGQKYDGKILSPDYVVSTMFEAVEVIRSTLLKVQHG